MLSMKQLAKDLSTKHRHQLRRKLNEAHGHYLAKGFIRTEDYAIEVPLDTFCSVCGTRQFDTVSGATCKNGHGGAPPAIEIDQLKPLAPSEPGEDYSPELQVQIGEFTLTTNSDTGDLHVHNCDLLWLTIEKADCEANAKLQGASALIRALMAKAIEQEEELQEVRKHRLPGSVDWPGALPF
jgi:hypothetical protein